MITLSVGDEGLLGRKDPRTFFALVHLFILKYPGEYIFCPREICCFLYGWGKILSRGKEENKKKEEKGKR